ncbi:MAG: ABC transporter substrate-binding protein, partial [Candidatus Hodarchaeota archaeon]
MTKATWIIIGIIIIIVIILTLFLQKAKEQEVVKIGAILPLTGNSAQYGAWIKNGIDMSVDEINGKGGINGHKVSVIYEDSQGNANLGVTAFRKLVDMENIKIFITAITSVILPILPIADEEKVLIITSSTHEEVIKPDRLTLRNYPTAIQEASFLADFAYNSKGLRKIALVYSNEDAWNSYAETIKDFYSDNKEEVLIEERYEPGSIDFRSILTKVKKESPEAIFIGGWKELANIFNQARELGIEVQLLGTNSLESPAILEV